MDAVMKAYSTGDFVRARDLAKAGLHETAEPDPQLLVILAGCHLKLGNFLEAAACFARAADFVDAGRQGPLLASAIKLYHRMRDFDEVMRLGPRAVALNPADSALAYMVCHAMLYDGRLDEMAPLVDSLDRSDFEHLWVVVTRHRLKMDFAAAIDALEQALVERPSDPRLLALTFEIAQWACHIPWLERYETLLDQPDHPLLHRVLPLQDATVRIYGSDNEALNIVNSKEASALRAGVAQSHFRIRRHIVDQDRLRIGYLSSDFGRHATMALLFETLVHHDAARYDIRLLDYSPAAFAAHREDWPEAQRDAIVPLADLSDAQAARRIDELQIDILVDLKGHTKGARPAIVDLSRAPVKAAYLGFPGSVTGVELDYAITDPVVTPDTSRPFYGEKLCRLPETYQANGARERPAPARLSRAEFGIPQESFVFASFNHHLKIMPRRLKLWAEILRQVPDALFWCMCDEGYPAENLKAAFVEQGIAPERIVMAGRTSYERYLGRARLSDLALDTAPCSGHTTTSDMLWAGLPVLTTRGNSLAGRVSASLLQAIDLPELVAQDDAAFLALAVALARDPVRLHDLRRRIEINRFKAPLFDAERFARHLEKAYDMMAERARNGLAPDHLDVPALPPRTTPFYHRPDFDGL